MCTWFEVDRPDSFRGHIQKLPLRNITVSSVAKSYFVLGPEHILTVFLATQAEPDMFYTCHYPSTQLGR